MERSIRRIGIIGAGAVGGAYGAMLYDADPGCVSFVAAGDRLRRLKKRGLVVNGKPYMIRVIDASDPSPPADLLIVAVKHHQLEEALDEMRQMVGEETAILSLMNGVESEEQIGRVYGADKVLPAVVVGIDAREGRKQHHLYPQGKDILRRGRQPAARREGRACPGALRPCRHPARNAPGHDPHPLVEIHDQRGYQPGVGRASRALRGFSGAGRGKASLWSRRCGK